MSTGKQTVKFGIMAAVLAVVIIAGALAAVNLAPQNGTTSGVKSSQQSQTPNNYYVLLTDPPIVPQGATQLFLTYSGITLQVQYPNGTENHLQLNGSSTVNLMALVNVTQTIAGASLPTGSTVQKVSFDIASVQIVINGTTHVVTPLVDKLTVAIQNPQPIGTSSAGTLLDLSPKVFQIQGTDSSGNPTSYYVLVPSATAVHKSDIGQSSDHVGDQEQLGAQDSTELAQAQRQNLTITGASLTVSGQTTTFSVTLKNSGTTNASITGLVLQGAYAGSLVCQSVSGASGSSTTTTASTSITTETSSTGTNTHTGSGDHGENGSSVTTTQTGGENGSGNSLQNETRNQGSSNSNLGCNRDGMGAGNRNAIPFLVNETGLVPAFQGGGSGYDQQGAGVVILPGQSATFSYTGVIQVNSGLDGEGQGPVHGIVITPVSGNTYTMHLMGEGYQTFTVTAS